MKEVKPINSQAKKPNEEKQNLKGTLFCVAVVGLVILVMWFGAYALYLAR